MGMWYRKASDKGKDVFVRPLEIPMSKTLKQILGELAMEGKHALIVGGSVRDAMLGQKPKDIDVEVYNSTFDELAEVLKKYGRTDLVGKSFGVIKFTDKEGNEYDFSVPRRDNKTGIGHRGFNVTFDDTITPKEAASRRDFTINALAYDPLTLEVHDYYGGVDDLENKVLKATSPAFAEDPLRVLRGMQFVARFGMTLHPETAEMCQNMITHYQESRPQMMADYVNGGRDIMIQEWLEDQQGRISEYKETNPKATEVEINKKFPLDAERKFPADPEKVFAEDIHKSLAIERLKEEWMKLATKGKHPGSVFDYLSQTGWIQFYPRLQHLLGVPQDPEWHPEGTVETHTAHVMNAAAEIADRENLSGKDRATLIFAAMTHDLAKSLPEHGGTTLERDKGGAMRWTSHGHEEAGGPMAEELLKSMGVDREIISRVVPLVKNHLQHIHYKKDSNKIAPVRQLADRIRPATLNELLYLIEADHSGRPPLPKGLPEEAKKLRELAERDQILHNAPEKIVNGRDVLPFFGGKPGVHVGEAVEAAYKAQLEGRINNVEEGKAWLSQYLKNKAAMIKGQHVLPYFQGKPGPHIGEVTNRAWEAQLAGEFAGEEDAQAWLANHFATKPESQSSEIS